MPKPFSVVGLKSDGIPQLRNCLPFVKKSWRSTGKKFLGIDICLYLDFLELVGSIQIDETCCYLFSRSCFAASFGALNQYSALSGKFSLQKRICYAWFIV